MRSAHPRLPNVQTNFPPPSRGGVDSAVGAESAESAKLLLEEGLPQETQAFSQGSRLNFQHQRKTKPEIGGDFGESFESR